MASKYFVGNATNWSSTTSWSTTSGGASGAAIPAAGDDVVFDGNSPGNCTIDVTTNTIRSLIMTGFTHTLTHAAAVTLNIGGATAPTGNTALVFAGTYTLGSGTTSAIAIADTSAATNTYNFNGATLGNLTITNGTTTTTQLTANGFLQGVTATLAHTQGGFNTNGLTCTFGTYSSSNSNTRSLTLGNSSITVLTGWTMSTFTNMTLSAASSTITLTGAAATFYGGGGAFGSLILNGSGTAIVGSGSGSFVNLTRTGTATKTDTLALGTGSGSSIFTISGTLTLTGNSVTNRLLVQSITAGAVMKLAAATVSITNCDLEDITGQGAAAPFTGTSLGDCGGNSGITFTAAAAQAWSGNTTGNWSNLANWTSRVPLPQDNVTVSGLSSGVITVDMPRMGATIDFTGSTGGTITLSNSFQEYIYGSWKLAAGMTWAGYSTFNFAGRGNYTITNNGVVGLSNWSFYCPNGTYTLQDNIPNTNTVNLYTQVGTFASNGMNVTFKSQSQSVTSGAYINFGNGGTWTITGTGGIWGCIATLSNMTGVTFVISDTSSTAKTFNGQSKTLPNLTITGGGTGAVIISGSNTFNVLSVNAPKTLTLTSGTTTTVSSLVATGTSGNVIAINSSTPGTQATIKKTSGVVSCDYLSLTDSAASGGATWYAGANTTNVSDNTGWIFMAGTSTTPGQFFSLF